MNTLEILEKNTLSTDLIRKFFTNKMFESVKNNETVPEEFKNYILNEGIDNESLIIIINSNPRTLFDLFDEHDIIIETIVFPDKTFSSKIGNQATTKSWKTRKEAEEFSIEIAFDMLEEKLKK